MTTDPHGPRLTSSGIRPLATSHFSALQPLLSGYYTTRQIRTLLTLSLLFWQKPTFSDTQIADNPHLFREFLDPAHESLSVLIRECFGGGEARLLLRDAFYDGPESKVMPCNDLADVLQGWKHQDMPGAWVVPPSLPNRDRFVLKWQDAIPSRQVLQYDYLTVKRNFQSQARQSLKWEGLRAEIGEARSQALEEVLARNWFSHSHIFQILNDGTGRFSDLAQRFGLMDETAYAAFFQAGISALNVPSGPQQKQDLFEDQAFTHISRILESKFGSIEVDALALLDMLTFEEIMQLRSKGQFLLDLANRLVMQASLSDQDLTELALALASYWETICDGIAELHPGGTRIRTKVGLSVARQSIVPVESVLDGASVIISGLAAFFTGVTPEGQTGLIKKLVDKISLRFLLRTETQQLATLRSLLSKNAILSAQRDII